MKLWKKILIGVGILVLLALGALGYGVMKVSDVYTEKIKPDMIKYVQMTKEDQDKYVLEHMEDLFKAVQKEDEKAGRELEAMQKDENVRKAGLELGRSFCASFVNMSDDITEKLSPEDKAKFKQEEDALDARSKHFDEVMKKYTGEAK